MVFIGYILGLKFFNSAIPKSLNVLLPRTYLLPKGLDKWEAKAEGVMSDQQSIALPVFRSQINHILQKEKNTDFNGYVNELHAVGEAAYKRSNIPKEYLTEAVNELKGIKKVRRETLGKANFVRFGLLSR